MLNKIVLVGVGLIGGSFALALKKAGYVRHITGLERDPQTLQRALQLGLIDEAAPSVADALAQADLVLMAAPVAQTGHILQTLLPYLETHTIVTDAGSTKCNVVEAARQVMGERISQFVPAHPIAGRETNGPEAAISDLFVNKKVVITPLPENTANSIDVVAGAWQACGALIHSLTPEEHDSVFATVSHLPHILAYALVDQVARHDKAALFFQYAASGFRDFTRIAGSSPEMWRDITLANHRDILQELDAYLAHLQLLREQIAEQDSVGIEKVFANAQQARMNWIRTIEFAEKKQENA